MTAEARPATRDPMWWHLLLIVALSIGFESLFVHHGLNRFDEGWPLYAAMRLLDGGTLYQDVFFIFPPGHLIPAWIATALAPPGIVGARMIYAAFNVVACVGLYLLGRRLMPAPFALLGALLLAVGAPRSHFSHLLFGYRYIVFSIGVLLLFAHRLRTGNSRWMLAAGLCAGVALFFRLSPAFAVSVAVGIAVMAATRDWRTWIQDWIWYGVGLLAVTLPVLAWFATGVGLDRVWQEVVVRTMALQSLQSLPMPELELATGELRESIYRLFVAVEFRLYPALYLVYAVALGVQWARVLWRGGSFGHPLLLAVVIWGGVFFLRTLGRTDEAHLDSALPPVCLLLAHGLYLSFDWGCRRASITRWRPRAAAAVCVAAVGAWTFLLGSDLFLDRAYRGNVPLRSVDGQIEIRSKIGFRWIDVKALQIREWTESDDVILDLTWSPILHVLTGRTGVGYSDIIMPGTFLNEEEEKEFLARLRASPPDLVVWPHIPFDREPTRGIHSTAPRIVRWVMRNYQIRGDRRHFLLLVPKEGLSPRLSGR
jgi:hypothetical protein